MAASWGTHRGTASTLSRSNIAFGGLHTGMVYMGDFQLQGLALVTPWNLGHG